MPCCVKHNLCKLLQEHARSSRQYGIPAVVPVHVLVHIRIFHPLLHVTTLSRIRREAPSGCQPLGSCCQDAEWEPVSMEERQASGVAMGSGLSCTTELAEAGTYVVQGLVRKCALPRT